MIEQASAGYGSGESAVEILSKIKLNLVPGFAHRFAREKWCR